MAESWNSPNVVKGVHLLYNGQIDECLEVFTDTSVPRFAFHRGEFSDALTGRQAIIMDAFITQNTQNLKKAHVALNDAWKVAHANKKAVCKQYGKSTAKEDIVRVAEAQLLESDCGFFLALSQLATHSYLKGFMNLNSAYGAAKALYLQYKDEDLDTDLKDCMAFTISWFWLYLSLLPEIIGPSVSRVLSWVTGLQGDKDAGDELLNQIARGNSIRKPLAILFVVTKYVFLNDMDFPRKKGTLPSSEFRAGQEMIDASLETWPTGPFFLFLSAYCNILAGELKKAQDTLGELASRITSRIISMNYGHSFMFNGQWEEAIKIYDALGDRTDMHDLYMAVLCSGMCHVMKNEPEAALEKMKKAHSMAAKNAANKEFKRMADRYADDNELYLMAFYEWKLFLKVYGPHELEQTLLKQLEQTAQSAGILQEEEASSGWFGFKSGGKKNTPKEAMRISYFFSKAIMSECTDDSETALEAYNQLAQCQHDGHIEKIYYWFGAFHAAQLMYETGDHAGAVAMLEKIKAGAGSYRLQSGAKAALERIAAGDIELNTS